MFHCLCPVSVGSDVRFVSLDFTHITCYFQPILGLVTSIFTLGKNRLDKRTE